MSIDSRCPAHGTNQSSQFPQLIEQFVKRRKRPSTLLNKHPQKRAKKRSPFRWLASFLQPHPPNGTKGDSLNQSGLLRIRRVHIPIFHAHEHQAMRDANLVPW